MPRGRDFTLLRDAQLVAKGVSPSRSFCSTLFKDANGTVPTSSTAAPGQIGGGISWNFPFVSMIAVDLVYIASGKLSCNDTFGPQGSCDTLTALVTNNDFASVLSQSASGCVAPLPVYKHTTARFSSQKQIVRPFDQPPQLEYDGNY